MSLKLKHKVILAFLFLSFIPLSVLAYISIHTIKTSGKSLISQIVSELEVEEEKRLIREAENYAHRVSVFLKDRENDLKELSSSSLDPVTIKSFWLSKKSKVWHAKKIKDKIIQEIENRPLYKEIALIDENGYEKIYLINGKFLPKNSLRNVANPPNTTYKNETYFNDAKKLKKDEIFVSFLTGNAMTKKDQLGHAKRPEDIGGGKSYDGVIRFSMPLFKDGQFSGVLTLALDHIHLQELSIHVEPKIGETIVFPSYDSGNYAFIFDSRGWIITHPKYWDLPGTWDDGTEKQFMTAKSSKQDIEEGIVGFNLDHAGFLSEGYPKAAKDIREKKTGLVTVTNVGGIRKVMAYAPIFYNTKPYNNLGIFGGFTLGAKFEEFGSSTLKAQKMLLSTLENYEKNIGSLVFFLLFFVSIWGYIFSKHITLPIQKLVEKTKYFGETDFKHWEKIERKDELGELAHAFYMMNQKINEQKIEIINSMEELKKAKKQVEEYNLYLQKKIDILKEDELRRVDRLFSLGQLAAGVAHEIRNPLTGITLFLDDLHDSINDADTKQMIREALKEIERLEKIVSMLLDYASPRTESKIEIEIDQIIDDVTLLIKKMCEKKNIKLERNRLFLQNRLNVNVDKVKQAFLNILLNAIQHVEVGGKILIDAKKTVLSEKSYVVVSISDNGPGIQEKDIEKIFEPFYSMRPGGTGLGLAISKSIINEHDGIIFAKNTEKGATFEIWLPEK